MKYLSVYGSCFQADELFIRLSLTRVRKNTRIRLTIFLQRLKARLKRNQINRAYFYVLHIKLQTI